MLRLEDLKAWVQSQGITVDIAFGEQPEDPTNNYTWIETGGLGDTLERHMDRPTFQNITRGSGATVARDSAYEFDSLIMDTRTPIYIGTGDNRRRVLEMGRVGGGPSYLGKDDRRRSEYTANYWLHIERG